MIRKTARPTPTRKTTNVPQPASRHLGEEAITADDVQRFTTLRVRPVHAEQIAAYANHRAAGLWPPEVRSLMDITDSTGTKYERWANAIRAARGLPPLPTRTRAKTLLDAERIAAASTSGTHSRWHAGRGITNPRCALCTNTTTHQENQ